MSLKSSEFPNEFVDALKTYRNVTVEDLPVLNLGDRMGSTDYIDFLQEKDMPLGSDLAVYKDKYGRAGMALHIKGGTLSLVIAVFQRYSDSMSLWCYGLYKSGHELNEVYDNVHDPDRKHGIMACGGCPPFQCGASNGLKMAVELVSKKDIAFRLINDLRT